MNENEPDPAVNPEEQAPTPDESTGNAAAPVNAGDGSTIRVVLSHGGVQVRVELPSGIDLGHIRSLDAELDEIGAPSNYNLGVNGVGQDDTKILEDGDVVSFRPVQGNKG